MISVIVPVYKAEKVISRCVASVIAQEYKDWELILVDDGSPDRSGEICDEYAEMDTRIRVLHQENVGASVARNHGIEVARGEYICFIDSDDYVSNKYLLDFKAEEYEVDFSIQGLTNVNEKREIISVLRPEEDAIVPIQKMFGYSSLWYLIKGPCCKLFRSKLIKDNNIHFPREHSYGEDEIFVLKYLLVCKNCVHVINKCNYYYEHGEMESLTLRFKKGESLYKVTLDQFVLSQQLAKTIGGYPLSYDSFYRTNKAIDVYQSVYNTWIDKEVEWIDKIKFLFLIDESLWHYIKKAEGIERGFKLIRFVLSITLAFRWR